jgi:hypothetical protein
LDQSPNVPRDADGTAILEGLRDEHDVRAACEHVFVLYRPPYRPAYSYMLGMYLGDGCLTGRERCKQFVVALDAAYPEIIDECWVAMALTLPGCRPVKQKMHYECVRVVSGSVRWPEVFPQHGPGRKHDRPIVLEPWQREIVDAFPREFLRGLIHSDGCRTVNRFKTKLPSGRVAEYAYPRYFFSNLSSDIRGLFCEYCERLGIRWTQSNHRNISVSHRRSVAALDEFIGPKR